MKPLEDINQDKVQQQDSDENIGEDLELQQQSLPQHIMENNEVNFENQEEEEKENAVDPSEIMLMELNENFEEDHKSIEPPRHSSIRMFSQNYRPNLASLQNKKEQEFSDITEGDEDIASERSHCRGIRPFKMTMEEFIESKLAQYSYSEAMCRLIQENCAYSLSLEEMVEQLNKDENNKWGHLYLSGEDEAVDRCAICEEGREQHIDEGLLFERLEFREEPYNGEIEKTCGICYSDIETYEQALVLSCGHVYCEECLIGYITFQISIGKVQGGVCCPDVSCSNRGKTIPVLFMQRHLMTPDTYSKYQKFTKRLQIYKDPKLKGCPTVDCEGFLRQRDENVELLLEEIVPQQQEVLAVICNDCKKQYCFKCLHPWHPNEKCEDKIDKDYEEWAQPNSAIVGHCKNCFIRIEKEGGCPHMICQMCKHEWCWICNQDFPVHTPSCPKYQSYLELLAFQGLEPELMGDETITPNRWFMYSGDNGSLCFWLMSLLFLLFIGTPCIVIFNVFVTPVYMLALIFSSCGLHRSSLTGRIWLVTLTVLFFIVLYSAVPVVFFIVTLPQLAFHFAKKFYELKDLCRNRCRRYRKLSIAPINNRLLRFIGLH